MKDQPLAERTITAKSLLLDLLRASEPKTCPVSFLVEIGHIFGISENSIRVTITRLLGKKIIEQDERGYYRLLDAENPLREWVSGWLSGEDRVVAWEGSWLSLSIAPSLKAKELKSIEVAAFRLGFREVWRKYWLRPDNLAKDNKTLRRQITRMSGVSAFILTSSDQVLLADDSVGIESLWDVRVLQENYRTQISALKKRLSNPKKYSIETVVKDTFTIGGDVIYLLAVDPLLPQEMIDTQLRGELTQLMYRYDRSFRPVWDNAFMMEEPLRSVPSHLQHYLKAI